MFETSDDWRVESSQTILLPRTILEAVPRTCAVQKIVTSAREQVKKILFGQDQRLLVVVGPCSIHDPIAALEYAHHLKEAIQTYSAQLYLIMRVYFEKPRTTLGWKGLINDPYLDNSHAINHGLMLARQLLAEISALAVPTATELIDTFIPHYLIDFITWGAIGARTAESRTHRELASSLAIPIGFKNNTNGNIQIAVDAVETASHPHHFFNINANGSVTFIKTKGNVNCHIILRGSSTGSNYAAHIIENSVAMLTAKQLSPYLMVDCSHGNSNKIYLEQTVVAHSLAQQIAKGNHYITGIMLESFLEEGKQPLENKKTLRYGQSITDGCLSWQKTLPLLDILAESVEQRRLIHPFAGFK